jgi:Mrp family chromosome partitioning ATPase
MGNAYYTEPIDTPHNIEQAAGKPVLGARAQTPRHRRAGGRDGDEPGAAFSGSRAAEAYLAVAAKLKHIADRTYLQTILVTSGRSKQPALVGEVAANLAVALAKAGEEVLLVDVQPQSTLACALLEKQEGEPAEHDDQPGSLNIETVSWLPKLSVGRLKEEGGESPVSRLQHELDGLKLRSALVIVAAPPLGMSSDGLFAAPLCDGVVLVAESGVRRDYVRQAAAEVAAVGGEILGCILVQNRARQFDLNRIVSGWQEALAAVRAMIDSRMANIPPSVNPGDEEVALHD